MLIRQDTQQQNIYLNTTKLLMECHLSTVIFVMAAVE